MNLLLTDLLACPRCDPPFGLVLLSEDTRDRRVYAGLLGCPNCRQEWRVSGGLADFRVHPDGDDSGACPAARAFWFPQASACQRASAPACRA